MISDAVRQRLNADFAEVAAWESQLAPEIREALSQDAQSQALTRLCYVEGYWRICETTPLLLSAIDAFNRQGELALMTFWSEHLLEEMGHDQLMYEDLCRLYGGPNEADAVLKAHPISPASAALVGYFHWQVKGHNPHLLMMLRLFMETFMVEMHDTARTIKMRLGPEATRTLDLHREADVDHVTPCLSYLDAHFSPAALPTLLWTLDFITTCLIESQLWVATQMLNPAV
jgi:hypothetical protein